MVSFPPWFLPFCSLYFKKWLNFSGDSKEELRRQALRSFLADHKFSPERVRFTYIFSDVQQFFVQALKTFSDKNDDNLAIIWRTDEYNLKFEWLSRYVSKLLGTQSFTYFCDVRSPSIHKQSLWSNCSPLRH